MAKPNEKKTRGKTSDSGSKRSGSKASRSRGSRRGPSGNKRAAAERKLVDQPTSRTAQTGFRAAKGKSVAAHRRKPTRATGKVRPQGSAAERIMGTAEERKARDVKAAAGQDIEGQRTSGEDPTGDRRFPGQKEKDPTRETYPKANEPSDDMDQHGRSRAARD